MHHRPHERRERNRVYSAHAVLAILEKEHWTIGTTRFKGTTA
jgi:hypothetical protein